MPGYDDILARYATLLSEVDNWFRRCSLVAGEELACQRGCSACCRGLFDITLLDACYLRKGIDLLQPSDRQKSEELSITRISSMAEIWPDFSHPFIMNIYPEEQFDAVMPDDDETPCPLVGDNGHCLVYDHRPMTCRLHGIPLLEIDGEVFFDEWCTMNFRNSAPLEMSGIRFNFKDIFAQEQLLFREFTKRLFNKSFNELDTVIPAAALIDFSNIILPEGLWNPNSF